MKNLQAGSGQFLLYSCIFLHEMPYADRVYGHKEYRTSVTLITIRIKEVKIMREGIHPDYHQATVTCNCGNTFVTGSTKKDIHVEICSKCHPFYTGQQKASRTDGRSDKFNKKYGINT